MDTRSTAHEDKMQITLAASTQEDLVEAQSLIHQYVDEMIKFVGETSLSDEQRTAAVAHIVAYWEKADHYPFLIYCDNELAGFSLVRLFPADKQRFDMGEFFVKDKFKGKGIGREAFNLTLAKFPGPWLVRVLTGNTPAFAFWKKIIADKTREQFKLTLEPDPNTQKHFFRFTV